MVRDGAGLERLAESDTVVFDKTGTLTTGRPELHGRVDSSALALAAALAARSTHPYARALANAHAGAAPAPIRFDAVQEIPGHGLEGRIGADLLRLGRADWALADPDAPAPSDRPATVLSRNGALIAHFAFREHLRDGAHAAVAALAERGVAVEVLSGDSLSAVARLAADLGVSAFEGGIQPGGKLSRLNTLRAAGHRVLMVGDGLNDAPALAAAHVSMAPADAVDVGRNAADFVFMRGGLDAVPAALAVSQRARHLIRQNFGLAVLYNAVALPFAVAGSVTPLAAALAMSASSILVVVNALRLDARFGTRRPARWRIPLHFAVRVAK